VTRRNHEDTKGAKNTKNHLDKRISVIFVFLRDFVVPARADIMSSR